MLERHNSAKYSVDLEIDYKASNLEAEKSIRRQFAIFQANLSDLKRQ